MQILEYMERYNYEQLVVCTDKSVGLRAFISIHDTTLGPALGGCRIWPHPTEEEAIQDALRLARAMTYKAAAAGLNLGGGKAVLMADSRKDKTESLFRSLGRFVDSLGGRYIATEDVGTTTRDMEYVAQETAHVTGLPISQGGSGDPSVATGYGVYRGIKACALEALGSDSLKGVRVAIQGFGKVASYLVPYLKEEGASIVATDIYPAAVQRAKEEFGLETIADSKAIFGQECDILAPCALGGALNKDTIPQLKCRVVAGAANNQLLTEEDGDELHRRGILYAPDYVLNAGGLINLSFEIGMAYDQEAAMERVGRIYDTMQQVIATSKSEKISTARAADRLAEKRIAQVRSIRRIYL